MITIEFTFETETLAGSTNCISRNYVYDSYKDYENVERVVALVKKVFSSKKCSHQSVAFGYFSSDYDLPGGSCEVVTSRHFKNYDGSVDDIIFEDSRYQLEGKHTYTKWTESDILNAYMNAAQYAMDFEWNKAHREEVGA